MKKMKMFLTVFMIVVFMGSMSTAENQSGKTFGDFNLTEEQIEAVGDELSVLEKELIQINSQVNTKFVELRAEIRKKDRFDTKAKEKEINPCYPRISILKQMS